MNKLCPKCYFLGNKKESIFSKLYIGIVIIMFGMSLYINDPYESNEIISFITSFISYALVFGGVAIIINHFRGKINCPERLQASAQSVVVT